MPSPETKQALAQLLDQISASDDSRFANLKRQQAQATEQRKAQLRAAEASSSSARDALRHIQEERARTEAAIAQAEALMKQKKRAYKENDKARSATLPASSAHIQAALAASRLALDPRKMPKRSHSSPSTPTSQSPPSAAGKVGKVLGVLFGDVRARSWNAKSSAVLEFERERMALAGIKSKDELELRALEKLAKEIRLTGGGDKEIVEILSMKMDAKAREAEIAKLQEARRLGKTIEDLKKAEEMSFEEKERQARIELEANRLTLIKLQYEKREHARKQLAEMQEKLKSLGLPAQIIIDHPEKDHHHHEDEEYYSDEELFDDDDDEMFGSGGGGHYDDLFGETSADFGIPQYDDWGRPIQQRRGTQRRSLTAGHPGQGRRMIADEAMFDPFAVQDPAEELFGPSRRRARNDMHHYGSADDMDLFGTLNSRSRGQMRRQNTLKGAHDPRLDLRRSQTAPLSASLGGIPSRRLDHTDPRLDPNSPYYDKRAVLYYKQQEEERRRAALVQQRAEKDKLIQKELERQAAMEERNHQLHQMNAYLDAKSKKEEEAHRLKKEQKLHDQNRREAEELAKREAIIKQEEELARLEKLLTDYPNAAIAGLDLRKAKNNPNLLADALRQVEENIARGKAPMQFLQSKHVNGHGSGASLQPESRRPQLREHERAMVLDFLKANERQQAAYLAALTTDLKKQWFLESALELAPDAQQDIIRNRYLSAGRYVPPPRQPMVIPTIVVEPAKSPPPQQDTMFYPEPARPIQTSQVKGKINKGKGKQMDIRNAPASAPVVIINQEIHQPTAGPSRSVTVSDAKSPSPPIIERNIAGHPGSGRILSQAEYDADIAVEEEEARLRAEMTALNEAEDRLNRQEQEERELQALDESAETLLQEAAAHDRGQPVVDQPVTDAWGDASEVIVDQPAGDAWGNAADAPEQPVEDAWGGAAAEGKQGEPALTAADDAWGAPSPPRSVAGSAKSRMPTPPPIFTPPLPPTKILSPSNSILFSPTKLVPLPDVADLEGPPLIDFAENNGETTNNDAVSGWGSPAPAGTPKSSASKVGSKVGSKVATPIASPKLKAGSKIASPVATVKSPAKASSRASTPRAGSIKAGSVTGLDLVTSPMQEVDEVPGSVKGASPVFSGASTPKATSPNPTSTKTMSAKAASPIIASPKAATPKAASIAASPSVKAPSQAGTPKAISPPPASAPEPDAWGSPAKSNKSASPAVSQKQASAWGSPVRSVKEDIGASPAKAGSAWGGASPEKGSSPPVQGEAWGSPAQSVKSLKMPTPPPPPTSVPGSAKSKPASPAKSADAWGSPAANSTKSSKAGTPVAAAQEAWGSPAAKSAKSSKAATPTAHVQDAWGSPAANSDESSKTATPIAPAQDAGGSPATSQKSAKATSPAAQGGGDAWGSPAASQKSVKSAAAVGDAWGASPPKHPASAVSPAFGMLTSPQAHSVKSAKSQHDAWGEATASSPVKAQKGSDPVVVSLASAPTPAPEASAQADMRMAPAEREDDHHDEGSMHGEEPFDPADFPVFYEGESVPEGEGIVADPPPHPFQQVYPITGPDVNGEAILNHFCAVAHQSGYDAIYQCRVHEDHEEGRIIIQGYFICLQETGDGHPDDHHDHEEVHRSPPHSAGKGKQAFVTEASESGW